MLFLELFFWILGTTLDALGAHAWSEDLKKRREKRQQEREARQRDRS